MDLKRSLKSAAAWVEDISKVATGSIQMALESGIFKDSLKDLCEIGGVAGALFKIGARLIPDPTAEQQIAITLHRTFLKSLDTAFKKHPDLVRREAWKDYLRTRGAEVAQQQLAHQFTWLSLFGGRGPKPSRSWPLVLDLADLGRTWLTEVAALDQSLTAEKEQQIDVLRGLLADELATAVEKLIQEPKIQKAWQEALQRSEREALELLAEELSTRDRYRLFGEVVQEEVYIPPSLKRMDLAQNPQRPIDWKEVAADKNIEGLHQALREGPQRLVVIFGEMGAGKSCLMRILTAHLARHYLDSKDRAPVFVRWRDVYKDADLLAAIARQIQDEYGLPLKNLPSHARVVYFIDGFDEMTSHENQFVWEQFTDRLAKLVQQQSCTVVVSMRSTIVTPDLKSTWQEERAFVVEVQPFDQQDVDRWALRWCESTKTQSISGDRLRQLGGKDVTRNPLMLWMLAKHVHPKADAAGALSRTEVFRIFVDETIYGKVRASGEKIRLAPSLAGKYRLMLQEMAYIASWPNSNGKCLETVLRKRLNEDALKSLHFEDVRTAFVLHFFDPRDSRHSEFEFQPEGIRQYLLAEWCVRAQLEALHDEDSKSRHAFWRSRKEAANALAQFPLREEERSLLDQIWTDLGRLVQQRDALARRLETLGVGGEADECREIISKLYERLGDHSRTTPDYKWKDEKVGIPEGQKVCAALGSLRMLVNYWDQCLLATFGLYRGLGKSPGN